MNLPAIKELIKDNKVRFNYLRKDYAYYLLKYGGALYQFRVPLADIGDATLMDEDKAIFFMRYIRMGIEDGSFADIS